MRLLLQIGGAVALTASVAVSLGGCSLGGFILAMVVVIVGLLAGGPVGRFKVEATREGASFEAESSR